MRVTTAALYQGIEARLASLSGDLQNLNEKLASGKRVNRPSDDPIAMVDAMQMKTVLAQFGQYARNLKTGQAWVNLSESVLSQELEIVGRAKEIAVEMAGDTQNAGTRARTAVEAGHLLDQAISLGNSRLGGRYIFAGYRIDVAPFSKVSSGGMETAQYHGDTHDYHVQIGKDETLAAGKNGQSVLVDSGLFDALGRLKKALEENDAQGIAAQLGNLGSVEEAMDKEIADAGARNQRLDARKKALEDLSLAFEERLAEVEEADFTATMVELKSKEAAYQAALLSATRINALTLLDYLR